MSQLAISAPSAHLRATFESGQGSGKSFTSGLLRPRSGGGSSTAPMGSNRVEATIQAIEAS